MMSAWCRIHDVLRRRAISGGSTLGGGYRRNHQSEANRMDFKTHRGPVSQPLGRGFVGRLLSPCSTGVCLCLFIIASGNFAAGRPALFFYSPPFRPAGSLTLRSPPTLSADQITTLFPAIPEMSGVVLMVYWSTLCPQADSCDFSLIDKTLDYWGRRGKKVLLAVATMGFPDSLPVHGTETLVGATPDWVLAKVY